MIIMAMMTDDRKKQMEAEWSEFSEVATLLWTCTNPFKRFKDFFFPHSTMIHYNYKTHLDGMETVMSVDWTNKRRLHRVNSM